MSSTETLAHPWLGVAESEELLKSAIAHGTGISPPGLHGLNDGLGAWHRGGSIVLPRKLGTLLFRSRNLATAGLRRRQCRQIGRSGECGYAGKRY